MRREPLLWLLGLNNVLLHAPLRRTPSAGRCRPPALIRSRGLLRTALLKPVLACRRVVRLVRTSRRSNDQSSNSRRVHAFLVVRNPVNASPTVIPETIRLHRYRTYVQRGPRNARSAKPCEQSVRELGRSDRLLVAQEEPSLGSHLVTPRRGYSHHGIYVGRGNVVHYKSAVAGLWRGPVEEVSLARFALGRAIWIRAHASPRFSGAAVARRALSRIGEDRYRLLTNNCEHFCEWCVQDERRSFQVEQLLSLPRRLTRAGSAAASRLPEVSGAFERLIRVLRTLPPTAARNPRPAVSDGPAPLNCAISAMHWCGGHPLRAVNWLTTAGLLALLLGLSGVPMRSQAQSLCETCEMFAGSGSTYHYWGDTGGVVVPVTITWGNGRYELGYFRMSTEQVLRSRVMAHPYNGLSVSRRWDLFEIGPVRMYFGFGLSGKSESDNLSVTRWDFASQLGVRFPWPGNRVITELTVRHWSNAGVRLPNHGQDFATLTFKINTGWVGVPRTDQIAADLPRALRSGQFASEAADSQPLAHANPP